MALVTNRALFSACKFLSASKLPRLCYTTAATESMATDTSPDTVKPFSDIPRPKTVPLLGNIRQIKESMNGKVWDESLYSRLAKEHGDLYKMGVFESSLSIVINDADAVKKIFQNEGSPPVRSTFVEVNVYKWIHDKNKMPLGMFVAHKNDWKRLRSVMGRQVTPRRLSHFTPPLSAIADDLCNHVDEKRDSDGWMKDIWFPMQMWAMKGVTKVVFNEDVDTLSGGPQVEKFVSAVQAFMNSLGEVPQSLPFYKIYPTKPYKSYVNNFNTVRGLAKELLNNHYEKLRADIEAGTVDEDTAVGLLDQWLIEGKLTEDEALVQACDMMFAGVDTTSNTATFMLHELAKNPDVQEAVYGEIMEVLGPHETPSAEHLQKLSLVRGCVKETLRLYPLVPLYPRELANDCVVMGYHIPAGTSCLFNFFRISKDPRYFDNPTKFNPERWSRDRDDTHPFASLPFGFGPRMCYGRRIAELELHLLLTRVLQRFKLSTDQQEVELYHKTVLRPNEHVKVRFEYH